MGQQWTAAGHGLWVQQTWVGHKPSWRRLPLTPPLRATRTYTGLGKQTLGWHKQNPVCTRTKEKGAVTPRRLTQTCPSVSRSPWRRHGSMVACCRVVGTEHGSACTGPFERGPLSSSPPPQFGLRSNNRKGTQPHASTEKIYWASEQNPISPSVSLSHQQASISLLSLSIREKKEWKPQSQKTNQTDHMDHSLV